MLDPEVLPEDPDLMQALTPFKPNKCLTRGSTLLRTPIGCPAFINETLMKAALTFSLWSHAIQTQLNDLQSKVSHFHSCLQATIPHLLATNVDLHSNSAEHPIDPFHWSSPFLLHLNRTTAGFLAHISGHPSNTFDPDSAPWILAHSLIAMGGLVFLLCCTCSCFLCCSFGTFHPLCHQGHPT